MTNDELRSQLHEGPVTVEFIKKSTGELRVMRCTLNGDLIPTEQYPKPPVHKATNWDTMEVTESECIITDPNLFKVYDLDKQGWRSFRYETITSVSPKRTLDESSEL